MRYSEQFMEHTQMLRYKRNLVQGAQILNFTLKNEKVGVLIMKKYFVYMDDGRDAFRVAVPAKSEKVAIEYVVGNGEVIAVKDVTSDFPIRIEKVIDALKNANFGQTEIDFIKRTLTFNDIAE